MWFKNIFIYRLNKLVIKKDELERLLALRGLRQCSDLDTKTLGWIPVRDEILSSDLSYYLEKQILICLGTEKKLLPNAVVRNQVSVRASEIELNQGYKLGRKQLKQVKETIINELLPRAFTLKSKTYALIDPVGKWLIVEASSTTKADEFVCEFNKSLTESSFGFLKTAISPAVAMKNWLISGETGGKFTIDGDCALSGIGKTSAAINYKNYPLEDSEIQKHIKSGMEVDKLALTWDNKISFILHKNLQLKRIVPLEGIKASNFESEDDDFDSSLYLMISEFGYLLDDFVMVLGGES